MSSRTFVCWDCRTATRAEPYELTGKRRCPECQQPLEALGWKIRIPPKGDARAWAELRERLQSEADEARAESLKRRVREIHELEREIEKLEARPETKQRTRHIQKLRQRLSELRRDSA